MCRRLTVLMLRSLTRSSTRSGMATSSRRRASMCRTLLSRCRRRRQQARRAAQRLVLVQMSWMRHRISWDSTWRTVQTAASRRSRRLVHAITRSLRTNSARALSTSIHSSATRATRSSRLTRTTSKRAMSSSTATTTMSYWQTVTAATSAIRLLNRRLCRVATTITWAASSRRKSSRRATA